MRVSCIVLVVLAVAVASSPTARNGFAQGVLRHCAFSGYPSLTVDRRTDTLYVGDPPAHRLYVYSSSGTLLRSFLTPVQGTSGRLVPTSLAYAGDGTLVLADAQHDVVARITTSGHIIAVWGRHGERRGQFNAPSGVALDRRGNVFIADRGNARIEKLSSSGRVLAVWGATVTRPMFQPSLVAVDRTGSVYYVDGQSSWVQKLSATGTLGGQFGDFGNPTQGEFVGPQGLALDSRGDVIATSYNLVEVVSPHGKTIHVWGALPGGSRPGLFSTPSTVAVDREDNIYVADTGNRRLQKLSSSGHVLRVLRCA